MENVHNRCALEEKADQMLSFSERRQQRTDLEGEGNTAYYNQNSQCMPPNIPEIIVLSNCERNVLLVSKFQI